MKRIIFILLNIFLGILFFYQFGSVFSQTQTRNIGSQHSTDLVEIIDLGTLGGETSQAKDLNENGAVTGLSEVSSEEARAFRWIDETMTPLLAPGNPATNAYAINESGVVAGEVISGSGSEIVRMPALWAGDTFTPLQTAESIQGSARAVNDGGFVTGHTIEETSNHILLWENSTLVKTIPVAEGLAQVNGLNNQNQIVGSIDDGSAHDAFLWQEDVFMTLGTLGGLNSIAHAINEDGKIVGESSVEEELATHAFLWIEGVMSDLGTIENVPNSTSRALGVNKAGVIVGEAQVGDTMHAVVWKDGQIIDLNSLLPPESSWDLLTSAASINDKGWIAGSGLIGGKEHAFLMKSWSPDYLSYLPIIVYNKLAPTPTATPTATPTSTPGPTSTPVPSPTPSTKGLDLARYLTGDGRLYEVHFKAGDFETQARHQTQFSGGRFYHTKGNEVKAEWEELWNDNFYIYRGTDTSPGNDMFYTLYGSMNDYLAGNPGSHWSERYMRVGDMYFRQPYVVFFKKSDCSLVVGGQYTDLSWLKFQAFHGTYTFETGLTLKNVVELAWMPGNQNGPTQPVDERYFYAEGYGLVGWKKPSLGWRSAISEEHLPGSRPNNVREEIPCINRLNTPRAWNPNLRSGPLPEPYASMVRP